MSEFSQNRLETRIKEIISTLIVTGQIKNHNLSTFTSVTEVRLAEDNANATVYVSSLLSDNSLDKSVAALNSAAAFIQSRIAKNLRTKNTPHLIFKADRSYREAERLNGIIDGLMKDIDEEE